jgi:hypothetical protein
MSAFGGKVRIAAVLTEPLNSISSVENPCCNQCAVGVVLKGDATTRFRQGNYGFGCQLAARGAGATSRKSATELAPCLEGQSFKAGCPSQAGAQRHRLQHARSIKLLNGQISQILQQPDISSLKRASASVDQAQRANAASVGKN